MEAPKYRQQLWSKWRIDAQSNAAAGRCRRFPSTGFRGTLGACADRQARQKMRLDGDHKRSTMDGSGISWRRGLR